MNFVGKAYVGEELVGSASGTFMTPRPFKKFNTEKLKKKDIDRDANILFIS